MLLTYYSVNYEFEGVDPADPNRILVRKLVMLNEGSYAYEESRITKATEEG